jgi:hypothetical protein
MPQDREPSQMYDLMLGDWVMEQTDPNDYVEDNDYEEPQPDSYTDIGIFERDTEE